GGPAPPLQRGKGNPPPVELFGGPRSDEVPRHPAGSLGLRLRDLATAVSVVASGSLTVVGTGIQLGTQMTPEARMAIENADVVLSLVAGPVMQAAGDPR